MNRILSANVFRSHLCIAEIACILLRCDLHRQNDLAGGYSELHSLEVLVRLISLKQGFSPLRLLLLIWGISLRCTVTWLHSQSRGKKQALLWARYCQCISRSHVGQIKYWGDCFYCEVKYMKADFHLHPGYMGQSWPFSPEEWQYI